MNDSPSRLVSQPELTRRRFLQAIGAGALVGVTGQAFGPISVADVAAAAGLEVTPIGATDGVLVLVTLYGGNDGLNTVVPFTNGSYFDARHTLAVDPASCLALDDWYGLHPAMPTLAGMWNEGRVAVVHGVGYNPPNRSHFASTANWMSGRFGPPNYSTGWIGRWFDSLTPSAADLAVAEVGITLPLHLRGSRTDRGAVAVPTADILIHPPVGSRMRAGLTAMDTGSVTERGMLGDAIAAATATTIRLADDIGSAYPATPLENGFVGAMTMAARLINANVGLRVLSLSLDGFDTHAVQADIQPGLLAQLDRGIAAFYEMLQPQWGNRVTLATLSEFGRSPHANASNGTDHGTSNVQFVIGANVAGGHFGQAPRLAKLDSNRQLVSNLDFRVLYANLIGDWLGGDGGSVVGGGFEPLGLFAAAPGVNAPAPQPAPTITSGYVPISPRRVFDTRDGTGGRTGALVAGEVWTFPLNGLEDVPGEARSVVLNLTAVNPTEPTFVTAWNAGAELPVTSNLNPQPGGAVPNLVVGRIGHGGRVAFANGHGAVDVLADLVGYFDPIVTEGMQAVDPYRLLDTRIDGGRLGPDGSLDLKVVDVGGVPADATGVALNITVAGPTDHSYLTVWPTGEALPNASSVNMRPGQTVPNMVFAGVGDGGRIGIFNRYGSVDVIVDVLGCFRPGMSRFAPVTPSRLLDTRIGNGAPAARVERQLTLTVAGRGGVPIGATAALLNVTAILPSEPTFITVFPTGTQLPVASNVNALPGEVVPNMVVARLGGDGNVAIFNGHGSVDLLADVAGYFV